MAISALRDRLSRKINKKDRFFCFGDSNHTPKAEFQRLCWAFSALATDGSLKKQKNLAVHLNFLLLTEFISITGRDGCIAQFERDPVCPGEGAS